MSGLIHIALLICFTISVSACIDRIGQDLMDAGISWGDPSNLGRGIGLGGKGKSLRAEPEPDLADRARFSELFEDAMNGFGDGLIGMEEDFAILITPEEANGEASAQLSPCGLIADASFEPGADNVEFGLGHGSFQSEQQPIIEESWVVKSIFIADQSIGDAAQIEQPIPIGIVASYSGDFDGQDKADVA